MVIVNTLLSARQLTFQRHGLNVFQPVDLALNPGHAIVIQGSNGAGKTTLLRLLAGVLEPSDGEVLFEQDPLFHGHLPAVKGDLSCRENLAFERKLGASSVSIASALLQVGLAGLGARPARSLSAGQTRRLGLARLLVRTSPIWLLDEPYASLDADGCHQVDQLIHQHLETGGGVILSTHQQMPDLQHPIQYLAVAPVGNGCPQGASSDA